MMPEVTTRVDRRGSRILLTRRVRRVVVDGKRIAVTVILKALLGGLLLP